MRRRVHDLLLSSWLHADILVRSTHASRPETLEAIRERGSDSVTKDAESRVSIPHDAQNQAAFSGQAKSIGEERRGIDQIDHYWHF